MPRSSFLNRLQDIIEAQLVACNLTPFTFRVGKADQSIYIRQADYELNIQPHQGGRVDLLYTHNELVMPASGCLHSVEEALKMKDEFFRYTLDQKLVDCLKSVVVEIAIFCLNERTGRAKMSEPRLDSPVWTRKRRIQAA